MKRHTLTVPVPVQVEGRFRAVVHTGHEFDEFGNIVKHGTILRETPFGKNSITLKGFENFLTLVSLNNLYIVAGSGNTAPGESDTTLSGYLGASNTYASYSTTRNVTPDGSGYVWWRTTKRATFVPGSLGGGSVNVAEAGITHHVGGTLAESALTARGLLVDTDGDPTTVSVDNSSEYLDLIWEYTEYVLATAGGSVTLNIDGVDTMYTYEVRPYWFDNAGGSYNYGGWGAPPANTLIAISMPGNGGYTWPYSTNCFTGSLVPISGSSDGRGGLGNGEQADIPIGSGLSYLPDSKYRDFKFTWLPLQGNKNITVVRVSLGHTQWQVSYSPAIAKVNTKQLDLQFRLTYANR